MDPRDKSPVAPNFCNRFPSTSLCSTSDAHRNVVLSSNGDITPHCSCFAWHSSCTSFISKYLILLAFSFAAIHSRSPSKSIPLRIDVYNTKYPQNSVPSPDTLLVRRNCHVSRSPCIQRRITDQNHARRSSGLPRQDILWQQRMGNLNCR